ncbi:putative O-methylsterigmatocystin oxidoreductase [Diaporthe sp. PMI_573]|nr:putative O-methylsterigmatocystin oxidoreductase [Diaporthaceae sp. PMI_573]
MASQVLIPFLRAPVLAILVTAAIAIGIWIRRDRRLDIMPGPKGWPLVGIGLGLPKQSAFMHKWGLEYGEVFKLRVGWYNWVVLNSPEAIKEIMDKQSIHTSSKVPAPLAHDVVTGGLRQFTMRYGPQWRAYRHVSHQVLSTPMTASFIPAQEFEAKQLLYDIAFDNKNQRDFYWHVRRFSFSIHMTATYGRRVNSWQHEDVRQANKTSKILGQVSKPGSFLVDELPFLANLPPFLQPGRSRAASYTKPILDARLRLWNRLKKELEAGYAPKCVGRELLENESLWKGQGLAEVDAAWNISGLAEAGSETSFVTMNNMILHLAASPDAQKRAYEELMRVVGPDRTPGFDDVQNLPYIRACVKEMLRLRPVPIWGTKHFTDEDVKYKDYVIPKGTVLLANTSFLGQDPQRYDEPFTFRPERFLNYPKYSAEYAAGDPYKRDHFAFGAGRRICPGAKLGENTLDIGLMNLLWAFEVRPPLMDDGTEATAMNMDFDTAFEPTAFAAPKPFAVRFVPRSEKTLRMVQEQWERGLKEGYMLGKNHVTAVGVDH